MARFFNSLWEFNQTKHPKLPNLSWNTQFLLVHQFAYKLIFGWDALMGENKKTLHHGLGGKIQQKHIESLNIFLYKCGIPDEIRTTTCLESCFSREPGKGPGTCGSILKKKGNLYGHTYKKSASWVGHILILKCLYPSYDFRINNGDK